ncbi:MAG: DUF4296 domain-containing protein [Firmicutes bacterium]|nr:DUF4296 domain-containing protein [Bacillota bacterium]MCM1401187.1 DUF4296 domain-containing protein [Bacteroides sp.]MCM1477116.1 DUF4296 domain-containing protein [Bacteroides sp.]
MKRSKILKTFLALTLPVMLAACSGRPSGVLSKEDMARLLADIHTGESVVESSSRSFPTDSARQAFLQAIYAKHGVTREEVDSSFSWYGYNIEKYMEVYDRTVEILEERLEKAQEIAGASADGAVEIDVNLQGDSVDVWPGIRWRRFASTMPNDHLTFALTTDRNWERGDVYTLRGKSTDNHQPLTFTITAEYSDGQREYATSTMPGDGWHQLQFALDSARSAQNVYGLISYQARPGEVVFVDSVSLYRTRWGGHYRDLRNTVKKFSNRTRLATSPKLPSPQTPPATTPPGSQKMAEPLKTLNGQPLRVVEKKETETTRP